MQPSQLFIPPSLNGQYMGTWRNLAKVNCDNLNVTLALCSGAAVPYPPEVQGLTWLKLALRPYAPNFTFYLFISINAFKEQIHRKFFLNLDQHLACWFIRDILLVTFLPL